MWRIISIICFVSFAINSFGQKKSEIAKITSLTCFGVDFSIVKINGADEEPEDFKKAFTAINKLFVTENEKYTNPIIKKLKIDVPEIKIDITSELASDIDESFYVTNNTAQTLDETTIAAQLEKINPEKSEGDGIVFIAKLLNKNKDIATYEIVIFNRANNQIYSHWSSDGEAGGFGLRNYWASSVIDAMKNTKFIKEKK